MLQTRVHTRSRTHLDQTTQRHNNHSLYRSDTGAGGEVTRVHVCHVLARVQAGSMRALARRIMLYD